MSDQYSPISSHDAVPKPTDALVEPTDLTEPNEDFELIAIDDRYFEATDQPIIQPTPQPVMVLPQRLAIAAIFIASVPACLVGLLAYQFTATATSDTTTQKLHATVIADRLNRAVANQYEGTKLLSQILARLPNLDVDQKQPVIERLDQYKQKYGGILANIAIFDVDGNLLMQSTDGKSQPLDQETFKKAIATNAPMVSKPTLVNSSEYALSFVVPINDLRTKKINGILRSQLPLKSLQTTLKDLNQNYLITDANGRRLFSTDALPDLNPETLKQLQSGTELKLKDQVLAIASTPSLASLPSLNWDIVVAGDANPNQFPWLVISIAIAGSALAMAIVTRILAQQLSYDLIKAMEAVNQISAGKFEKRLIVNGDDEISQVSNSINAMTANFQILLEKQQKTIDQLQRLISKGVTALQNTLHTNGEDTNSIDIEAIAAHIQASLVKKQTEINLQKREKDRLQTQLNHKESEVITAQTKFKENLSAIEDLVGSLNACLTNLQTAANEDHQSHPLLVTQITEMLLHSQNADFNTNLTSQEVLHLRETIATTSKKVKRLGESSQKISKIASVVSDIAINANFLAVNASIKGLRSEDASEGFAIVVAEVSKLAEQSAAACQEMEQLAGNIQSETSEVMAGVELGTTQVAETTQLVTVIKQNIQQITDAVDHLKSDRPEQNLTKLEPMRQIVDEIQKFVHQLKTPS